MKAAQYSETYNQQESNPQPPESPPDPLMPQFPIDELPAQAQTRGQRIQAEPRQIRQAAFGDGRRRFHRQTETTALLYLPTVSASRLLRLSHQLVSRLIDGKLSE